jgi:hypothetical protein
MWGELHSAGLGGGGGQMRVGTGDPATECFQLVHDRSYFGHGHVFTSSRISITVSSFFSFSFFLFSFFFHLFSLVFSVSRFNARALAIYC